MEKRSPSAFLWHGLKTRVTGCVLAAIITFASCNRQTGSKQITQVRLGYFANLSHAQAVLGVSSGEFAKAIEPVELKTNTFNAGPALIEALLAGNIDVGYVGPGPALAAQERTHGEGIRVIAAGAANGVVIVAREGSGIKSLEDLKGKKIATPQHGNTQDLAARHYLQAVLKQPDTSNVVPRDNPEQAGLMTRELIDASWAPEPWGSLLVVQANAKVIAEEKDIWSDKEMTVSVIVTTPEFLSNHWDIIEKILRVHRQWTARLQNDPAGSQTRLGDAIFAITGKRLPEGVLPQAFSRIKFTDEPRTQTFESLAQWSYELGFEREKPDLTGLFDTSILHKLEQETPATKPGK